MGMRRPAGPGGAPVEAVPAHLELLDEHLPVWLIPGYVGRWAEWHVDLEQIVTMEKLGSYPACPASRKSQISVPFVDGPGACNI